MWKSSLPPPTFKLCLRDIISFLKLERKKKSLRVAIDNSAQTGISYFNLPAWDFITGMPRGSDCSIAVTESDCITDWLCHCSMCCLCCDYWNELNQIDSEDSPVVSWQCCHPTMREVLGLNPGCVRKGIWCKTCAKPIVRIEPLWRPQTGSSWNRGFELDWIKFSPTPF